MFVHYHEYVCAHICTSMHNGELKSFDSSWQSYYLETHIHPASWKTSSSETLPCHLPHPAPASNLGSCWGGQQPLQLQMGNSGCPS